MEPRPKPGREHERASGNHPGETPTSTSPPPRSRRPLGHRPRHRAGREPPPVPTPPLGSSGAGRPAIRPLASGQRVAGGQLEPREPRVRRNHQRRNRPGQGIPATACLASVGQRCVPTRPSCARRRCRRPAAGCSPVGPDCWRTARRPSLIRTAAPGHRMLARPPLGAGAPRPAARSSTGAGAVRPSRLPFASSAGSCSSTQGWRGARRSGLSCRFDSGVGVPAIGTGIPVTFRPEGGASGQESRHGTGRRVEVRDEPPTSEPWPAWVDERWRTNGADAATKERAAPAPSDAGGASRGAPAITSTHPRTAAVRQREEHRKSGTGSVGGGVARFEAVADAGLGVAVAGTAWAALEPAGKLGHVDADGRSKVPPPAGPRAAAGSGSGLVCSRLGNRADARRRAGPPATRSGARNVGCAPAHPRFRSRRPRAPGEWWRFRDPPPTATSTSPNLRPDPRAQLDRARFT